MLVPCRACMPCCMLQESCGWGALASLAKHARENQRTPPTPHIQSVRPRLHQRLLTLSPAVPRVCVCAGGQAGSAPRALSRRENERGRGRARAREREMHKLERHARCKSQPTHKMSHAENPCRSVAITCAAPASEAAMATCHTMRVSINAITNTRIDARSAISAPGFHVAWRCTAHEQCDV